MQIRATLLALLVSTTAIAGQEPVDIASLLAACSQCHTPEGKAAQPGWAPLSEMEVDQIIGKLSGHRDLIIPDAMMSKVAFDLSDEQIEALAEYYSRQVDTSQQPVRTLNSED